jgi:hypothetical protein
MNIGALIASIMQRNSAKERRREESFFGKRRSFYIQKINRSNCMTAPMVTSRVIPAKAGIQGGNRSGGRQ